MLHYHARGVKKKKKKESKIDRVRQRSVSILQGMEDIPNTAQNSQHSFLYAVSFFCPVYPFPISTHPRVFYTFSLLCFQYLWHMGFSAKRVQVPSTTAVPDKPFANTETFLKFTISLHTLGNVARWQTVFVVGVGRCWRSFFFMCVVRGGTNGALNQTQGGTHHPARRLNLRKYPPPLTDKPCDCSLELDAVRF